MHYELFPDATTLMERKLQTPEYMHPNHIPYVILVEGYLSNTVCDAIIAECETLEPYSAPGCMAETKECPMPLSDVLYPVKALVEATNAAYWNYDLDPEPAAWFQTYGWSGSYAMHMDGSICQSRKLTGLALLTDPKDYDGGELRMHLPGAHIPIPKTRGTVVMFPFWMWHEVTEITRGKRQTINVGFYGPQFR